MQTVKKLWNWMRGYRLFFFIAIFSALFSQLFVSLAPQIIKIAIDGVILNKPLNKTSSLLIELLGGKDFLKEKLWILGSVFLLTYVLRCVFTFGRTYFSSYSCEGTIKKIKDKMYDRIQRMPYSYQQKTETGDLIQRCTSDTDTVRRLFADQFPELVTTFFLMIFVGVQMFSMDLRMSLISISVFIFVIAASFFFFNKIGDAFGKYDEQEAKLTVKLQEALTAVRVIKAFGTERREINKFNVENEKLKNCDWDIMKLFIAFWTVMDTFFYMQLCAVLVGGTYFCIRDEITVGTFIAFVSYVNSLYFPVIQLGRNLSESGKAFVSVYRISEVLEKENEELFPTGIKDEIKGSITFENVSLRYENGEKNVLEGVSFEIDKGKTLAIIGPTGSGKSSLVQLLPRLYEYDKGSIKIDGIELKDIDKGWIRKNIGLILQEPFLFQKTAKENILAAVSEKDEKLLIEVSKKAAIHDDIKRFSKGYDTLIGEKGVSLSGGQRQRMAIARMLALDTGIIIFDDSLSAVDTETDLAIRKALFTKDNKKTLVIISHRISTVKDADLIVVLEKGKVTEKGNHKTLIEKGGLYKRLYDIQSAEEV